MWVPWVSWTCFLDAGYKYYPYLDGKSFSDNVKACLKVLDTCNKVKGLHWFSGQSIIFIAVIKKSLQLFQSASPHQVRLEYPHRKDYNGLTRLEFKSNKQYFAIHFKSILSVCLSVCLSLSGGGIFGLLKYKGKIWGGLKGKSFNSRFDDISKSCVISYYIELPSCRIIWLQCHTFSKYFYIYANTELKGHSFTWCFMSMYVYIYIYIYIYIGLLLLLTFFLLSFWILLGSVWGAIDAFCKWLGELCYFRGTCVLTLVPTGYSWIFSQNKMFKYN